MENPAVKHWLDCLCPLARLLQHIGLVVSCNNGGVFQCAEICNQYIAKAVITLHLQPYSAPALFTLLFTVPGLSYINDDVMRSLCCTLWILKLLPEKLTSFLQYWFTIKQTVSCYDISVADTINCSSGIKKKIIIFLHNCIVVSIIVKFIVLQCQFYFTMQL